jgi:hypothetical protein
MDFRFGRPAGCGRWSEAMFVSVVDTTYAASAVRTNETEWLPASLSSGGNGFRSAEHDQKKSTIRVGSMCRTLEVDQ